MVVPNTIGTTHINGSAYLQGMMVIPDTVHTTGMIGIMYKLHTVKMEV